VKADIMISRHAGSDGHLTLVRLDDPSTQVLPLIGLWTVTLGSLPPFAAVRLNGRSRNSEFIVRSATNDWTCPPSRACVDPRADTADARLPGSPGFGQWHDHFDRALIKGARYGARKER